jgi:tetratricopeptide (TPR) repeat protein
MMKLIFMFALLLHGFNLKAQDYISFQNSLNEGNYWFYEGNFDSALVYYQQAEKFKILFYPEESHCYSRTLWEIGDRNKSISILKKGGFDNFFIKDTTYYPGLSLEERRKIASKMIFTELDILSDEIPYYDKLVEKDQSCRKILLSFPEGSVQFDSMLVILNKVDSINFEALVERIKLNGFPGGYKIDPIGPYLLLLHAGKERILREYQLFMNEIKNGRMSHLAFTRAVDRFFSTEDNQSPYNSYLLLEEREIDCPELIFINRCKIGMSPYYDMYVPRLYPRGQSPNKSRLYDYYKRKKESFNCGNVN